MLTMQIARMLHSVQWVAEHVVECISARYVGPKGLIRLAAHYLYSIQFVGSHIDRYLLNFEARGDVIKCQNSSNTHP